MSDFEASRLGSQEHWQAVYERELANFQDIQDEGEIWFGQDAADEVIDFVQEHLPPVKQPRIIDVGSGNGHLLFGLVEVGYDRRRMTGADYSQACIALCQEIAKSRNIDGINFQFLDCLRPDPSLLGTFDLALDKGTFDAISLAQSDETGQKPLAQYAAAISSILADDGSLCITSCNFTLDELKEHFHETDLSYTTHLPRPTFTFGGVKGNTITTALFVKKAR